MAAMYRQVFWKLLEYGLLPDSIVRYKVHGALSGELQEMTSGGVEAQDEKMRKFLKTIRSMPIAIEQSSANDQHYEVPAEFFHIHLGPNLKYSGCLWKEGCTDLGEAEVAMLELYCKRAQLKDGMAILDLGCGWGSLGLFLASKYPKSKLTLLSNSNGQREFIMGKAKERGLTNVQVYTGDIAVFQREDFKERFDRVMSVEMFEHMKNYGLLLEKLSGWLNAKGKLFVHIFAHRNLAYHFEKGWMARTFFTGGSMPSHDLFLNFQDHLALEDRWMVNGVHYAKTLDAWLAKLDENYEKVKPILEKTYGSDKAARWFVNWRMFYIVCSETFGFNEGNEWFVSHYLFAKR